MINIVSGAIGAIIGLFSSCDDTYEVITEKHVVRWPCKNYRTKLITNQVPKSSCVLEEILVNGGFKEPKQCNCLEVTCSVKTSNLSCIQQNRICQKMRENYLEGIGKESKLHSEFEKIYMEINNLQETIDLQFNQVEQSRKAKDIAVQALNRTLEKVNILKQESLFANKSKLTSVKILARDICVLENYITNKGALNFNIVKIDFNSMLPITDSINLVANVKTSSGTIKEIHFVYNLMDAQSTTKAASRRILYMVWCPSNQQNYRQRRSLDGEKETPDTNNNQNVLSFVSWDDSGSRENLTLAEESCITFKKAVEFLRKTIHQLRNILSEAISTINMIENTSQKLINTAAMIQNSTRENSKDNIEVDMKLIKDIQIQILDSVSSKMTGFRNRSEITQLFKSWTELAEIYTIANNMTICLSYEDCVETAFESLENLPFLPTDYTSIYRNILKILKRDFKSLLADEIFNLTTIDLNGKADSILKNITNIEEVSIHCSKPPVIKSASNISIVVMKGQLLFQFNDLFIFFFYLSLFDRIITFS